MMFPLNRVICGDAFKVLKRFPDGCVDMVLTSPPYWNLRNYGVKDQMGLESDPQEYINRIATIFDEVKRVLKKTGSLYLNLGDTYCGVGSDNGWLCPKQLLLLPPRIAIAMQERGWLLRNLIIWHKPNSMPSSVKDRLTNTWEYLFFFVKSRRYYFDLDAIRVPHKTGPSKFNYRVREAKRGDKMIIGVHAKPEEMARYNSKGVMVSEKRRKTANEGYKASGMRNAPEPSEPNAFHPAGKNPGDVLTKHDLAVGRIGNLSYSDPLHVCAYSVSGKNPGDTVRTDLRARLARAQNLHTFYTHSHRGPHLNNPKGKNPGDAVSARVENNLSHFREKGSGGHFDYGGIDSPEGKHNHPLGRNPGDTFHFNDDYWFDFIRGAAHISWKHKLAFETIKKWMIENNCQDYAKFYEWYKRREKGNWGSGNLIEGKANYLKSSLPFPNPNGTNPGDILNVGADTHRKSRGVTDARRDGTWGDDHPSRNPERWFSAEGKNPGEFWTIKTRPFKGAHFAVFPEDLCVMPIEAACPRWICNRCGKPRMRITKPTEEYARLLKRSWTKDTDKDKNLRMKIGFRAHTKQVSCTAQYETVGWSDCGCNAGFKPGIVLDPFAGSGTVGIVAKRLSRNFILIDINREYCELARKRLREAA
jgi:DNA modification methylase